MPGRVPCNCCRGLPAVTGSLQSLCGSQSLRISRSGEPAGWPTIIIPSPGVTCPLQVAFLGGASFEMRGAKVPSWREAQRGPCPTAATHTAQPLVCPRGAAGAAPRPGRSGAQPSSPRLACSGGRIPSLRPWVGEQNTAWGRVFFAEVPIPLLQPLVGSPRPLPGSGGVGGVGASRAAPWPPGGPCAGSGARTHRSQASDGRSGGGAHPQERSGASSLTEWAPAAKGAAGTLLPLSWGVPPQRAAALGGQKGPLGRDSSPREWGQRRSSQGAEDAAGSADHAAHGPEDTARSCTLGAARRRGGAVGRQLRVRAFTPRRGPCRLLPAALLREEGRCPPGAGHSSGHGWVCRRGVRGPGRAHQVFCKERPVSQGQV